MDKITFICPIYNSYPQIISALICQTHQNWELILIHDGPNSTNLRKVIEDAGDKRITYIETETRVNKWGHPWRRWALEEIKEGRLSPDCDYVVITNADNYHVPVYCEYLLNGFRKNPAAVAAYGSMMVHSYPSWQAQMDGSKIVHQWGIMQCWMQLGHIDCAGVMIKKGAACEAGWRDVDSHSSDWVYFEDVIKRHGKEKFVMVPGCLLVHN